jgi:hypothetical protein
MLDTQSYSTNASSAYDNGNRSSNNVPNNGQYGVSRDSFAENHGHGPLPPRHASRMPPEQAVNRYATTGMARPLLDRFALLTFTQVHLAAASSGPARRAKRAPSTTPTASPGRCPLSTPTPTSRPAASTWRKIGASRRRVDANPPRPRTCKWLRTGTAPTGTATPTARVAPSVVTRRPTGTARTMRQLGVIIL